MITIGCDPEFFVARNGHLRSAHDLVPGDKHSPHKLNKGAVQRDGTAIEINIDPAKTADEFQENVLTVLEQVRVMVPKEYEFVFRPAVTFQRNYFTKEVPEGPKELGCNPDWDAWSGDQNPNPSEKAAKQPYLRTGSGHIHIGWGEGFDKKDPTHFVDCRKVVQMCDEFYDDAKKWFDNDTNSKLRQFLYGKRGAFRPTSFGVEYRVPSNAWLGYPNLYPFMFDLIHSVMEGMDTGHFKPPAFDPDWLKAKWAH